MKRKVRIDCITAHQFIVQHELIGRKGEREEMRKRRTAIVGKILIIMTENGNPSIKLSH